MRQELRMVVRVFLSGNNGNLKVKCLLILSISVCVKIIYITGDPPPKAAKGTLPYPPVI